MTNSNVATITVTPSYVDEFRRQCLRGGVMSCTKTVLHDKWLVTKKLADLWWELKRIERETVAKNIITNYMFFYIPHYRSGTPNCKGGTGNWKTAVCNHNSLMRLFRFGDGMQFYDDISKCYWSKDKTDEHCYIEEDFGLPVKKTTVATYGGGWGHAICAFQMDKDSANFDSWRFFQYDNSNIKPGNWQMPCGWNGEDMYIAVTDIIAIPNCAGHSYNYVARWNIDTDCNITPLSISTPKQTDKISLRRTYRRIMQLQKTPELCVVGWEESPDDVKLFVSEFTTQNLALQNKFINDKKIHVYIAR